MRARLRLQMYTTTTPMAAMKTILMRVRLSGGATSPLRRRRSSRRYMSQAERSDDDRHRDPALEWSDVSPHEVVEDPQVGSPAVEAGVSGERPEGEHDEQDPVEDEQAGEGHDERRKPEPGDQGSLGGSDDRTRQESDDDGRPPRPVRRGRLHELHRDRTADAVRRSRSTGRSHPAAGRRSRPWRGP